jgi:FMN phosphatase YigB (HAD superfamily)
MSGRRAAVLFDLGDTLVRRPEIGPGTRIAEALGAPRETARAINRILFREPFAAPAPLAARLRDALALAGPVEEVVTAIWLAQEHEPVEVAGATALVAAARDAGARIGVVSNIWAPYEAGVRRACPALVPLVESWHLSYRAGTAKPEPGLFQAALAALDVPAGRALMVGDDRAKDVAPALALGMRAVWVDARGDGAEVPAGCVRVGDLVAARAAVLTALRTVDSPAAPWHAGG